MGAVNLFSIPMNRNFISALNLTLVSIFKLPLMRSLSSINVLFVRIKGTLFLAIKILSTKKMSIDMLNILSLMQVAKEIA